MKKGNGYKVMGWLAVLLLHQQLFAQSNLYPYSKLHEVPFNEVKIKSSFWSPLIQTIADTTLPLVWQLAAKQGRIENFKIVAGLSDKKYSIRNSPDAPVYKLIEGAAYSLAQTKNETLEKTIDEVIDWIALAQDSSGYMHTQFMLDDNDQRAPDSTSNDVKKFGFGKDTRWIKKANSSTYGYSQLFTAGHLFEAAAAYYRATGKRKLLDVAIKFANHIYTVFSDTNFVKNYGDHPEFEIGIMRLYEITGDRKYIELNNKIARYAKFTRPVDIHPNLTALPLYEQTKAYGHCVRSTYLYTGATDLMRATGAGDLQSSIFSLYKNVVGAKTYIHGGIGNGTPAEQHGEDYDLPIYLTYSECCANIAMGQWNNAMNLLTGDAGYADMVEHEMYNSALSGISADGKKFFYSNKINVDEEGRKGMHSGVRETYLFCCPSKLPTFISGVARWMYAKNDSALYINQYIGSEVKTIVGKQAVEFAVVTDYPWSGGVSFKVANNATAAYAINFRIPYWVRGNAAYPNGLYSFAGSNKTQQFTIKLNGRTLLVNVQSNGYVNIKRKWKKEDVVTIDFDMPVQRLYSSEKVVYNNGRVALMRGPVLYCLEGIDNHFDLNEFELPAQSKITKANDTLIGKKIVILTGTGRVDDKSVQFKAIPYYFWNNRGVSSMQLLPAEDKKKIYKQKTRDTKIFNTEG